MEWTEDVALAAAAAVAAGRAAMQRFGSDMEVTHKAPDQPLTETDLEANRILHERLLGARPDYGWLSEETADDPGRLRRERVWIVDPIDGTRSFIAGRPEFAISIGVAENGRARAGVVLNPATGELFAAWQGGGAWKVSDALATTATRIPGLDGPPDMPADALPLPAMNAWTPIHVRETAAESPRVLASRSEIREREFEPFSDWTIEPLGSTAYKLAKLAEGAGDVFLSRGPKSEWDVCAGGLLVQEAGGIATDLRGHKLRYNERDPRVYGILAAAGWLHKKALRRVRELPPPERLERRAVDALHPGLDEESA
ncbi:MAG TPA: 3'(2'),5'-bisphosphate nucleotidase CysQ [Longimicrobiales bacterium]